jgi:hypothetical protein
VPERERLGKMIYLRSGIRPVTIHAHSFSLQGRLMVGRKPLKLVMLVRIQPSQLRRDKATLKVVKAQSCLAYLFSVLSISR